MAVYVLSPEALEDLQNIWDFVASDSVNAASKLQDRLFDAFESLARFPGQGHTRTDLTSRSVRFWPVGAYLVAYRLHRDMLQIVAVLHGARDVAVVLRQRS